jgi:hypothetical protein
MIDNFLPIPDAESESLPLYRMVLKLARVYIFSYYQPGLMDAMVLTGMLSTIAQEPVFLCGLTGVTASTNKPRHQIPNRIAETLQTIVSTFGIAQGFRRRFLVHSLAGGGSLGYHAFVWETILHGNAGKFGKYTILH